MAHSIAKLVHGLTHQHQVCVKRARTCTHAIDVLVVASKLDGKVCYAIVKHIDMHLSSDRALFIFGVGKRRIDTDGAHRNFGISLTREWYLNDTVQKPLVNQVNDYLLFQLVCGDLFAFFSSRGLDLLSSLSVDFHYLNYNY